MDANELADGIKAIYTNNTLAPTNFFIEVEDMLRKLQFENDAFRKELFNIGSMRACQRAAHHHGFVSPAQAGDEAREYIAEILKKAKNG